MIKNLTKLLLLMPLALLAAGQDAKGKSIDALASQVLQNRALDKSALASQSQQGTSAQNSASAKSNSALALDTSQGALALLDDPKQAKSNTANAGDTSQDALAKELDTSTKASLDAQSQSDAPMVPFKRRARSLEKVLVSATGFSETSNASIRNSTILDEPAIEDKGYQNLGQALSREANITFIDQGLGSNIDMRGQGGKSNIAVKVMVDGNSINVLDGAHGVTPLYSVDINNVEQVEIIAGGGAVLFGNGTRGGVINIITRPHRKSGVRVGGLLSGFMAPHNFSGKVNAGATIADEHLSASLDVTGYNNAGYQEHSRQLGYFATAELGLFLTPRNTIDIRGVFMSQTDKGGMAVTKAMATSHPRRAPKGEKEVTMTRPTLALHYLYDGDDVDVDINASYAQEKIYFTKDVSYSIDKKTGKESPASSTGSSFHDEVAGVKAKVKYNYNKKGFLIAGYDYAYQRALRNAVNETMPGVPMMAMHMDVDMSKQSHSLFIMNQNTFKDYFTLSLGARYEYAYYQGHRVSDPPMHMGRSEYTSPFQDSHSYAVEITPSFAFHDKGLAYFKYERGYITPYPAQFTNKKQENKHGVYYSSGIKPETYDTFEVGVKDYFHKGSFDADIKATLYYTWTHDEIMHEFIDGVKAWKYYNADSTGRLGLELSSTQSYKQISFTEALSYIYATILKGQGKGKVIPHVPSLKVTGNITYTPLDNLSIYTDMSYTYGSKDSSYNAIKNYYLMDLGVAYEVRGFTIAGGFHNITNTHYYISQDSKADSYMVGNGASGFLEVRYRL